MTAAVCAAILVLIKAASAAQAEGDLRLCRSLATLLVGCPGVEMSKSKVN
ncbi:hypothetical protein SAMN04487843_101376 [Methylobacterium sp. ap11]|nr:hypothetical protein [Methylobacterium sp. ap11]SEO43466.1 hypothetical protein SAMN04487843_101376 [Methylobacterium sp. ap11]